MSREDEPTDPQGRDYKRERDAAYTERNKLVAALARLVQWGGFSAWLAQHPADPDWDPEWRWIVFVDGPTGQMSWHLHDSELGAFTPWVQLRPVTGWDGHSTEEKYERLERLEGLGPGPNGRDR